MSNRSEERSKNATLLVARFGPEKWGETREQWGQALIVEPKGFTYFSDW